MAEANEVARQNSARHTASLRMNIGAARVEADLGISTKGLLAIGGMVSLILLAVTPIIGVSTRKLPNGTIPAGMQRSRF